MANYKLTNKQEKFCQLIAIGSTQKDAYIKAYNTENMKDKSVIEKASELAAHVNVSSRIDELRQLQTDKFIEEEIYTVAESFKKLNEIQGLALCPNGETGRLELNNAIKAEELKGKLAQLYIERKDVKISEFNLFKKNLKSKENELDNA